MAEARPHPRLQPGEEDFPYDRDSVLTSKYHMDARKPVDRLLRYERVLDTQAQWPALDFADRRGLEIGCGPLLGWGPIAVYLGARRYVCIEPRFQEAVLLADEVWTRFFLPLHQQLEAVFARGVSFADFADRIRSRIHVHGVPVERCELDDASADLVISNGVLQHVADLDGAMQQIRRVSCEGAKQLHVVHFTDHVSPPDDPFHEIYRQEPADYFAHDSLLNLKRPSEVAAMFHGVGISVTMVPYLVDPPSRPRTLAPYWRRFDPSDLAIQIAFFVT